MRAIWNRLDSYVFREINAPFLMAMLVYNGIFFIRSFITVAQLGGDFEIPLRTFTVLFLSFVPEILYFTVPMSFLFGSLAAISRMSSDSELIAPQSAGLGFWRLNRPIFLYGLLLSAASLAISNWAEPYMKQARINYLKTFMESVANPTLNPGVITTLGPQSIFFIDHLEGQTPAELIILNQEDNHARMTYAQKMEIFRIQNQGVKIRLENGNEKMIDRTGKEGPRIAQFNKLLMDFPNPTPSGDLGFNVEPHELETTPALMQAWLAGKLDGEASEDLWQRIHFPMACFFLSFFALPLAGKHVRLRRGSGFGFSLGLILIYFVMAKVGLVLVERHGQSPVWALGVANYFFFLLGLFVLYRRHQLSRENRKKALGFIGRKIYFSYKAISSRLSGWRRWDTTTQIQQSNKPFKPRRFPSRIDFYLLRNFLVTYALIQSSILGLIALIEYSDIMKFADKNHIERIVVLKYLVYRVPNLLETSLFISVLVAVLISLAVMSKNQEITAIRAAGGSLRRLCLPLLIMGVCFTAGEYYLGARFMPAANRMAMNLRYQIKNRNPGPFHKNWIRTAGGHFLNFEFYNPTERMMYNAVWYEIDFAKGGVISRTETARIQLTPEGTWVTESPGSQWRFSKVNDYIQPSPALVPKGQVLPLDVTHEDLALRERKPEEFSIAEYRSYMNYVRDLGIFHPRFPTEFYAKWTQPILPFLMVLLAAPLGFQFGRRGTFFGLASGLVLGLAFWGLYVFFLQLGRIGLLPPVVSAWSVLVLFGVTAVFRFLQMER